MAESDWEIVEAKIKRVNRKTGQVLEEVSICAVLNNSKSKSYQIFRKLNI
jgi:hypothetical protein